MFNRTTSTLSELGVLCPVEYRLDRKYIGFAVKLFHGARVILYPIFSSSRQACPEPTSRLLRQAQDERLVCRRACPELSRRDAKTAKNEIPISNIEIRNNIKIRMTKIPNCLINCFEHLYFRHYHLFPISDFVLRICIFV